MRRILYISLTFLWSLNGSGQLSNVQKKTEEEIVLNLISQARNSRIKGNLLQSLQESLDAKQMAAQLSEPSLEWQCDLLLLEFYQSTRDIHSALEYGLKARELSRNLGNDHRVITFLKLLDLFESAGLPDKQLEYIRRAREETKPGKDALWVFQTKEALALEQKSNYSEAYAIWQELSIQSENQRNDSLIRHCQSQLSRLYMKSGKFEEALRAEDYVLKLSRTPEGRSISLNNIGLLHIYLHRNNEAETKFSQALSAKGLSDELEGEIRFNLALASFRNSHHISALDQLDVLLRSAQKRSDSNTICLAWYLKSKILLDMNDQAQAENYASEAIPLAEESGLFSIAYNLHEMLADIAEASGEGGRSKEHRAIASELRYKEEHKLREQIIRDTDFLSSIEAKENQVLNNITTELNHRVILQKELDESKKEQEIAELCYQQEIQLAALLNEQVAREKTLKELALVQAALREEQQQRMITTLESEKAGQKLKLVETEFEREASSKTLSLLTKENQLLESSRKIESEKNARIRSTRNLGLIAAVLLLSLLAIVSRSYYSTQLKNKLIAEQSRSIEEINEVLQERNDDILSGIINARNFQESIISREETIQKHLPESFLIYQPLDIVSGDIPFILRNESKIYLGAIDCIGHGVSAAMLSFMAYYNLKELIESHENSPCGEVLSKLHVRILKTLSPGKEREDFASGIDISLCMIDLDTRLLQFAGANLPVILLADDKPERIKGELHSVGDALANSPIVFKNHERYLRTGDRVFLLSDGLIHQFGGESGQQKYSMKRLLGQLSTSRQMKMAEVKKFIDSEFRKWKKQEDQTDDLMLIGIAIP